jgi:hypothetical protein
VAVPSQAAALKAWGSRQNLFRDGLAKSSEDKAAIAAALAKPGVVLRRPAGSNAPYSENPGLPRIADMPKKKAEKNPPALHAVKAPQPAKGPVAKPRAMKEPAAKPPDRTLLDAAEKALADLKREEQRALAALDRRKAALDEETHSARTDFRNRRAKYEQALIDARRAYQRLLSRR